MISFPKCVKWDVSSTPHSGGTDYVKDDMKILPILR